MMNTILISIGVVCLVLGFVLGWIAYYFHIKKAFQERQGNWREMLNQAEHKAHTLTLKKEKLEHLLIDATKRVRESDTKYQQLEQEAKAHSQQFRDLMATYKENFEAKEGELTQQIATLRSQSSNDLQSQEQVQTIRSELNELNTRLQQALQEKQELAAERQQLMQQRDETQDTINNLRDEMRELQLQFEKDKSESIEQLEQSKERAVELQKQVDAARISSEELQKDYSRLKEQYNEIVANSATTARDEQPLEELEAEYRRKEDALNDRIAELEEKIRQQNENLGEKLEQERERSQRLQLEIDQSTADKNQLAADILKYEQERSEEEKLRAENARLAADADDLGGQNERLTKALDAEKEQATRLQKELGDLSNVLREKEVEWSQQKSKYAGELSALEKRIKDGEKSLGAETERSASLAAEIEKLKTHHHRTKTELEAVKTSDSEAKNKILDLNKKLNLSRSSDFEKRANALADENAELLHKLATAKQELSELKRRRMNDSNKKTAQKPAAVASTAPPSIERKIESKKKTRTKSDDLTRINGVGPVISKKLKSMGYRTFNDIAKLRKKDIEEVDAKLNFKGRIEREQWVVQAKALAKTARSNGKAAPVKRKRKASSRGKTSSKVVVKKARVKDARKNTERDDLKQIKGIGPVLEKKLNQMGINTFAQIASLNAEARASIESKLKFKGRIAREKWVQQAKSKQ